MRLSGLRRRTARAAALPLVLWAVFVMTTVLVVTLGVVDFDIEVESLAGKQFCARQVALTGLAYASHPKVARGDPLLWQSFPDGSRLEVEIQSEDARLNINTLLSGGKSSVLSSLFRFWGIPENETSVVVDSLKDWTDADEFRGLNGAESGDLPEGTPYSRPENRPFLAVSEMQKVRGMEAVAKAKPDWADFFSVRSSNKLDLHDVSPDLLQVLGMLTPDQAKEIVSYRKGPDGKLGSPDDPKLDSVEALGVIVSLNPTQLAALGANFGTGSTMKRIVSRGYCAKRVHEIAAVTAGDAAGGFLEWQEK